MKDSKRTAISALLIVCLAAPVAPARAEMLGAATSDRERIAAVLARDAGIRWIYQVLQPDSTRPPHPPVAGIAGVRRLADLRDSVLDQLSAGAGPESPPP